MSEYNKGISRFAIYPKNKKMLTPTHPCLRISVYKRAARYTKKLTTGNGDRK